MLLKQNWLLAAARPPWDGSLEGRTPGTGEGEKGLWQGMELEGGAEALAKPKPFVGLVVLLLQAGLWCAFSWGQEQPGGGYCAARGVPWDRGTQGCQNSQRFHFLVCPSSVHRCTCRHRRHLPAAFGPNELRSTRLRGRASLSPAGVSRGAKG